MHKRNTKLVKVLQEAAKYGNPATALHNSGYHALALAMDAEIDPDDDDSMLDRVLQFLQTRLDPADFADLCELVGVEPPPPVEDPDDNTDMEVARPEAEDEPPPFRGRPNTGGAMDAAARSSFARRFPNAGRVQSEPTPDPRRDRARQARINELRFAKEDAALRARGIAMDANARPVKSFAERFPMAKAGSV